MSADTPPFFGRIPKVGETVYIDFGDSVTDHPEVEGTVEFISEEHITVAWDVRGHHIYKRFHLAECKFIEVYDN